MTFISNQADELAKILEQRPIEDDVIEVGLTPDDRMLIVAALRLVRPASELVDEISKRGTHERWKPLANACHTLS